MVSLLGSLRARRSSRTRGTRIRGGRIRRRNLRE